MKKHFLSIPVLFLLIASSYAQSSHPDGIIGLWKSPDGSLVVKIDKIGYAYQGRIAWIDLTRTGQQPLLDEKNPEPHLRTMPLKGNKMLKELTFNTDKDLWDGGVYYDPDEGKLYNCIVEAVDTEHISINKFLQDPSEVDKELWLKAN